MRHRSRLPQVVPLTLAVGAAIDEPANTAVATRRMEKVKIEPYRWASGLREWEVTAP